MSVMVLLLVVVMTTTRVHDDNVGKELFVKLQKDRTIVFDCCEPEKVTTKRVKTHLTQVNETTSICCLEDMKNVVGVDVFKEISLTTRLETFNEVSISQGQHFNGLLSVCDRDITRVEITQEIDKR